MGVFDVPASDLIEEIAVDLREKFKIEKPAFADYVKTGVCKERAPQRQDWYYVRIASILYRIFKEGPLGVGSLRTYYGGRQARGVRPHKFEKASGKIIRKGIQDLEKAGLLKKAPKGRTISPKGQSYLIKKSKEVKELLPQKKAEQERLKAEKAERLERMRSEQLKRGDVESGPREKFKKKGKEEKGKDKPEEEKK
ncbi:MAG: 30S ribosomal protein S19e [Candidatus Diapherotrites archaeon]|nr:30S ribosomal protein S19e [Candidatus Diapherotrites archaeon]